MDRPSIGKLIGSGRVAEIFAYGADVLKLYRSPAAKTEAFREAAALGLASAHGLPVPEVIEAALFDGRWGVAMSRAPGETLAALAEADPSRTDVVLDEMVSLHRLIHSKVDVRLPSLKRRLAARINEAKQLDAERWARLLGTLEQLPDGDRLCHGDFHPFNIMGAPGSSVIVDWLDATSGPPEADACRTYVLLAPAMPALAEAYVERYAERSGLGRDAILRWLPVVAAARLAEGTPDEAYLLGLLRATA
jgi:aminoglycoside phosphotransferase (APT) family kinase protein